MNKDKKLKLLTEWHNYYLKLEKLSEALDGIFGCLAETQFFDTVWDGFDIYTKNLGLLLNDQSDWLPWFWLENRMGLEKSEVQINNKTKKIETLEDLLSLI